MPIVTGVVRWRGGKKDIADIGLFGVEGGAGARYAYLTTQENNRLTPTQAQTVIAAAILRHLHAVITIGRAWDPIIATHGTRRTIDTNRRESLSRRIKLTAEASPTRH